MEVFTTTIFVYLLLLLNGLVICIDNWNGPWFPYSIINNNVDTNPIVANTIDNNNNNTQNIESRRQMGVITNDCDDCKTNYDTDLDMIYANLCFDNNKWKYSPRSDIAPIEINEHIPVNYMALHICKNDSIEYDKRIPTFGPHLPNWLKYGEYEFVPKQRWLHNLEHGAIVMLYHPCADKNEVNYLKKLVRNCLYRHVITPYIDLTSERPLALVAWGDLLEMSKVSKNIVVDFIKRHALHGPEQLSLDGHCDARLIRHAELVSDLSDQLLCPNI